MVLSMLVCGGVLRTKREEGLEIERKLRLLCELKEFHAFCL